MTGISLSLSPLLPWSLLGPALIFAFIACVTALVRRTPGSTLRAAAALIITLQLLDPSIIKEERTRVRDVAAVIVDMSPSQQINDRPSRTERAIANIEEQMRGRDDIELRTIRVPPVDGNSPVMDQTRLAEALGQAFSDIPPRRAAGAILLTDGQVHDIPKDLSQLTGMGPVHVLLTGDRDEADRRISIIQAPAYGTLDHQVRVGLRVDDQPARQSNNAVLTIRQGGKEIRQLQVPVGRDVEVDLLLQHAGQNVFEFSVEPATRELSLANNKAIAIINGVREQLKVLLISGEPHNGERTWRNILKSDPSVNLVHFTILRPPERQDGTPVKELSLISFPIRELFEIKLNGFDLVIFDRYRRRGILPSIYLQNISDYVMNGGALLEASGASFASPNSLSRTLLGLILPAKPSGEILDSQFRPMVTKIGQRHPVTATLMSGDPASTPSWGRWFQQMEVASAAGTTLMEGNSGQPLLLLDRVGSGRVAQLTSDQIWLWGRGFDGGGPHTELIRRLVHWLMKEPELEENNLSAKVDGSRITIERRSLEPADDRKLRMTTPSGREEDLTLVAGPDGIARMQRDATEPGIYQFNDSRLSAVVVVGAINPPELSDMRTTSSILQPLVRLTGGGTFWLQDREIIELRRVRPNRDAAGRDWLGLRANEDYVVTGIQTIPVLPVALVLLALLTTMLLAWWREGR